MRMISVFLLSLVFTAVAQQPVPILPQKTVPLDYNLPTGNTWAAHTASDLTNALASAQPNDVIVLDPGVQYVGAFRVPAKSNPNGLWIYIVTSGFVAKHPSGTRVSPNDAADMAAIITPNTAPALQFNPGVPNIRLTGVEVTSASTYVPAPNTSPCGYNYFLIGAQFNPIPLPGTIIIDRSYIHGDDGPDPAQNTMPCEDMVTAVQGTATGFGIVDSYISQVHAPGQDSQAFGACNNPGPITLINNYFEAAGENVMFGGAGKDTNQHPSDIWIQYNVLNKPLSWVAKTVPPNNQWVEKNAFECKDCTRVFFDHNQISNVWVAGQRGYAVPLTVRTSQSGDSAVVNDITITNNTLTNVVSFVNALGSDDLCGPPNYPQCQNAGSQDRWKIANNSVNFYDPTLQGGGWNVMMEVVGGWDHINNVPGVLKDVVFENNNYTYQNQTQNCLASVYFSVQAARRHAPWTNPPLTNNIWLLNNTLCRQPSGDYGFQGQVALDNYMGFPTGQYGDTVRFQGNQMALDGGSCYTWPAGNTCF